LSDNFCFHVEYKDASFVVDCSEPHKLDQYMQTQGQDFTHVLTTHKHNDHSGGNTYYADKGKHIVGGAKDTIPACDMPVEHGQVLLIGEIKITCLHTPCHTRGHILYLCEVDSAGDHSIDYTSEYQRTTNARKVIFTGDTIFVGGCGRFFEGEPSEMVHAMQQAIQHPDALMFCGHEYTVQNLEFCQKAYDCVEVAEKLAEAKKIRADGKWTVPVSI
jgi:hydroxyacylglutathione hydrolase